MKYLGFLFATVLFTGCSAHKSKTTFPDVPLDTAIASTEFVTTMQHHLLSGKNIAYTPAFLRAWELLSEELDAPITTTQDNTEVQLLNQSATWRGALLPNEYLTIAETNEDRIRVAASFSKKLQFKPVMDTNELMFRGQKVRGFGMNYLDYAIADQLQILYYESDEKFILKVIPKDRAHEILFAKGFDSGNTFEFVWNNMQNAIIEGIKEKKIDSISHRYHFGDNDNFLAPAIRFDHNLNMTKLTGTRIIADDKPYLVTKAAFRISFLIHEGGAEVISEAGVEAAAAAEYPPPPPKHFILDKPFFLLMKRNTAKYPYFMMRVENTDIMTHL